MISKGKSLGWKGNRGALRDGGVGLGQTENSSCSDVMHSFFFKSSSSMIQWVP